jgi:hypothetical protein
MDSDTWPWALAAACACGSPASAPATHVVIAPLVVDAGDQARVPDDPADAYEAGVAWLAASRSGDAMRAFHRVIDAALTPNGKVRGPPIRVGDRSGEEVVREGEHVAIPTGAGVLVVSAKTGAVERLVRTPRVHEVKALGDALVSAALEDGVAIVDVDHGVVVARIADAQTVERGEKTFAAYGSRDQGAFVEVWDRAPAKRRFTASDPALTMVMNVHYTDDQAAVIAQAGGGGVLFDASTGKTILAFTMASTILAPPGISRDGRYIAYGNTNFDKMPMVGTTFLYDRTQKKVIATSHAVQMPSGFAFDGKWLAVGDLRKGCLLAVPQMMTAACSKEIRPYAGPDDDLQDARPTFVDGGRALELETSDGSAAVVKVPSMTMTWKGRARLSIAPNGAAYLVDDDNKELLSIGAGGAVMRVRALADDEGAERLRETHPNAAAAAAALEHVDATLCHAGDWVFPKSACAHR